MSPGAFVANKQINSIRSRISNYIHNSIWDVNVHPCPNFNGGLTKPPLTLGRGWMAAPPLFYVDVITYPRPHPDADFANHRH